MEAPKNYLEVLKDLVLLEEEKQVLVSETELLTIENIMLKEENEILTKTIDEQSDYSSIHRIAEYNGVSEALEFDVFSWRRLAAASTKLHLEVKKVPCLRFETKNLYSHDAWKVAYPGVKLPAKDDDHKLVKKSDSAYSF